MRSTGSGAPPPTAQGVLDAIAQLPEEELSEFLRRIRSPAAARRRAAAEAEAAAISAVAPRGNPAAIVHRAPATDVMPPGVVVAVPMNANEFVEEDEGEDVEGCAGRIRRNRAKAFGLAVLVAVAAAVGGVVAAVARSSSPSPSPPPSDLIDELPMPIPVVSPTPKPTYAPMTPEQERFMPVLAPVSSQEALGNPNSAQNRALRFLVDEGGKWGVDPDDPAKHRKTQQRFALITMYYSTGGENSWSNKYSFLADTDDCQWQGTDSEGTLKGVAVCNEAGLVTDLHLVQNNLIGTIPPELQALTNLQKLNLANNTLTGSIPPEITRLSSLRELCAFNNRLSGTLPSLMGDLRELMNISMQNNNFSGPMPGNIGNANKMTDLLLQQNRMDGALPSSMGNLTSLKVLFLEDNRFSGGIPTEMGNMLALQNIRLSKNNFTGGMNVFCKEEIKLARFYADCLGTSFPEEPPQVECECCTICCDEEGICLPNN